MAEHIPEGMFTKTHYTNIENVHLELYRLLTIFLSSKNFAELRTDRSGCSIIEIQQFEESEITRILLHASIVARVTDDQRGAYLKDHKSSCGKLIEDISNGKERELSLRMSCNKIMHAKKVHFDTDTVDDKCYINPILYLYGDERSAEWKATLNVIEFVKMYISLIPH